MAKHKKKKGKQDKRPSPDRTWANTGRLLGLGHRRFEEGTAERVRARGHGAFRVVHSSVLRNMDRGGTRTTELARRAGVTKQAMGQLVKELVKLGYLDFAPDPSDNRAKLVVYTPLGSRLATDALAAVSEVQDEFKARLGKGGLKDLRRLLEKL